MDFGALSCPDPSIAPPKKSLPLGWGRGVPRSGGGSQTHSRAAKELWEFWGLFWLRQRLPRSPLMQNEPDLTEIWVGSSQRLFGKGIFVLFLPPHGSEGTRRDLGLPKELCKHLRGWPVEIWGPSVPPPPHCPPAMTLGEGRCDGKTEAPQTADMRPHSPARKTSGEPRENGLEVLEGRNSFSPRAPSQFWHPRNFSLFPVPAHPAAPTWFGNSDSREKRGRACSPGRAPPESSSRAPGGPKSSG